MDTCPTVTIATANGPVRIDAHDFDPERHDIYVAPEVPPAIPPPPPPPPPPFDPLAAIRANPDWRDTRGAGVAKLKDIAAAVSDGRMPANRDEAVAMIEAALAR